MSDPFQCSVCESAWQTPEDARKCCAKEKAVPQSVWQGSFRIFGVDVRCHVLDNGQRIIEADSMHALLRAMGDSVPLTEDDGDALKSFARWQRGGGVATLVQ